MNAIDIDNDGHIIVSSCYLDEVTKINRQTKEIIWRLGGAHSDFIFENDEFNGFSGQHSVRVVGSVRIFDSSSPITVTMSSFDCEVTLDGFCSSSKLCI